MGQFITADAARDRFRGLAAQVGAAYAEMRALSSDEVGNAFRVELAEWLESQERTNRGLMYRMFGEIADPPHEAAMAPVLVNNLAARLRIPPKEVKRRMKVTLAELNQAAHAVTNPDKLFFACPPNHKLVTDGHYQTTVTDTGRLAWTDGTTPPDINHAHHPEELLYSDPDPPDEGEE
jgi:hypothetical protein